MKRKVKPYLTFTKNTLERTLTYRANSIIFFLGNLLLIAVTFYLWLAIYGSSSEKIIKGFSLHEMIVYVILSFIVSVITHAQITSEIYREVKDGSIATYLIKPINYERRLLFESFGSLLYNFLLIFLAGFIIVLVLSFKYSLDINFGNVLLFFISTLLGFVINFFYSFAFGLLSFKITNMWGLAQIMSAILDLLSGALIPLVFFPNVIQKFLDFLPFKSMIYTPCMIYLGKLQAADIIKSFAIQVIWIIILYAIARAIWNALIKQLTILGG